MKILLLLSSLIICLTTFSQNVGIGTTTPTNQLHVLSPIPANNPLRVENLKQSNNPYDGILVTDNNGVIRYIPSSLILNDSIFSSKLDSVILSDSIFIKGLIDTLTINGIGNNWQLTGNSGTNPSSNFVGTTDAQPLVLRTNNTPQMRIETNGSITMFGGSQSVFIRAGNTAPTVGSDNVAIGSRTLNGNTSGRTNVAIGSDAMQVSTTANENVAVGEDALHKCTNCQQNTAIGMDAMWNVTSGSQNVSIGNSAGRNINTGNNNTAIHSNGPFTGSFSRTVGLGWTSNPNANNFIRIGGTLTTSIGGYQNWTNISDGNYKKNIIENVPGLDFIMQLRPVTYNLEIRKLNKFFNQEDEFNDEEIQKEVNEAEKVVQTGFIAQEVEAAAKQTGYDFSGLHKPKNEHDHYGLKYAEFVAPMVKAMQEQQQLILELKKEVESLKKQIEK